MKFYRSLTGQMRVAFLMDHRVVERARKISDIAPASLQQPMFQPLAAGEYAPRAGSDLQGTWEGKAHLWFWPFHSQRGTVRIAEPSPGNFRAELDFPEQHANNLPLSVIYHPPGVELVLRSGEGMFKGSINRDHTKMTGYLFQGGHSADVTLWRAKQQPASEQRKIAAVEN